MVIRSVGCEGEGVVYLGIRLLSAHCMGGTGFPPLFLFRVFRVFSVFFFASFRFLRFSRFSGEQTFLLR